MVSDKKIKEHLLKPFPQGFYSISGVKADILWAWLYALTVLVFLWIAINTAQMFKLGIIYTSMGILAVALTGIEWVMPRKTFWGASSGVYSESAEMDELVFIGLILGIGFVTFQYSLGSLAMGNLMAEKSPLVNLYLVGFAIPVIEVGFFAGVLTSSFVERYGVVFGLSAVAVLFAIFHYSTWGLTATSLLALEVYRLASSYTVVKFRSVLPSLVAHIIINSLVVLVATGLA